jgi:hypothetical protein
MQLFGKLGGKKLGLDNMASISVWGRKRKKKRKERRRGK